MQEAKTQEQSSEPTPEELLATGRRWLLPDGEVAHTVWKNKGQAPVFLRTSALAAPLAASQVF